MYKKLEVLTAELSIILQTYRPTVPSLESVLSIVDPLVERRTAILTEITKSESQIAHLKAEEANATSTLVEGRIHGNGAGARERRDDVSSNLRSAEAELQELKLKLFDVEEAISEKRIKAISKLNSARRESMDDLSPLFNQVGKVFEAVWQVCRARAHAIGSLEWEAALNRTEIFGAIGQLTPIFSRDVQHRGLVPSTGKLGWVSEPSWTKDEDATREHQTFEAQFSRVRRFIKLAEKVDELRRERKLQDAIKAEQSRH